MKTADADTAHASKPGACAHPREVLYRDENENRVRCGEYCRTCNQHYHGCIAKRLDEEGREAWGKPGVQNYWAVAR